MSFLSLHKAVILAMAMLTCAITALAQSVGIGTATPAASAQLDVSSTTKGVLVPRVTTAQMNAIAAPDNGLLVYNTDSAAFAYRDASGWLYLRGNANRANGWSTLGNAGTDPATHFIGTTDEQPVVVRQNNQRAGFLATSNTSWGVGALNPAGTGTGNIALGAATLNSNTTGSNNVAVGINALSQNTTRSNLVAVGDSALFNNGSGATASFEASGNTAVGSKSLYDNTTGYFNTATGADALSSNTTGNSNTANGRSALINNTTGSFNTANGSSALINNTTGGRNTAIGADALSSNTTGSFNTAVGRSADVTSDALTNATAIGYLARVNASNKIRLGNAAVTVIEGQVPFTHPSDGRFKTNVSESDVKGLDFIIKLRPVVYNFDTRQFDAFARNGMPEAQPAAFMDKDYSASVSIRQSGFIAQEVEKAAREAGYNFNGLHTPENDKDYYSLSYSQFVVPLVKGMQEQQQMIATLEEEIAAHKKKMAAQEKQIAAQEERMARLEALLKALTDRK